ncbi:MAG TPA: adenine phosphoribosyltransferase [Candidatus Omnitrophota bacterium]|nr:adenine phosphoribosyltransferase [Candidatus Omnitrophota bacterium]HSA31211.1 adenine phosphoribosyltransferase [Candidatus Omnitrophota bacterium]
MQASDLAKFIRDVPDFPKKGIIFKDITPLLQNAPALRKTLSILAGQYKGKKIDYVVAMESRGFIFGAALAAKLGAGFVPVRKPGKLPYKIKRATYQLEYGTDTLEIHQDALPKNSRVLIVDDLLATGGTAQAVLKLVRTFQADVVGIAFVIELVFLNGRKKLKNAPIFSILKY